MVASYIFVPWQPQGLPTPSVVGDGEAPVKGQSVKVHYTGKLENGKVFDSSVPRGEPLEFAVGTGQVIPGWDEGILTMRVGGKRQLKIPSKLGYGARGVGPIPPNATLLFDCELVALGSKCYRFRMFGAAKQSHAENLQLEEAADHPPPSDWVGPQQLERAPVQDLQAAFKEEVEPAPAPTPAAAPVLAVGAVESFISESSRWRVKLSTGDMKDLKAENLRVLDLKESQVLSELDAFEADLDHFVVSSGDRCGPEERFVLEEPLGEGTFSTVYRCHDASSGARHAVKFTKSNEQTRRALEREVKIMRGLITKVAAQDPEGMRCILCLAFFETFVYQGRLAAIFELMKCNLRTALAKYGAGKGLPLLPTVRDFGWQLLCALRLLRTAGLIHCDVKPENLLLAPDNASIKLCDFGSCLGPGDQVLSDQLMPRNYRAPEIILGQEYSFSLDIWSAAATIFELATDQVLFKGDTNNEMLLEMMKVCGPFPLAYVLTGHCSQKHFGANGDFLNAKGDVAINSSNPRVRSLDSFDPPARPLQFLLEEALRTPPKGVAESMVINLCDLLSRSLKADASQRPTPETLLAHQFFQKGWVPSPDALNHGSTISPSEIKGSRSCGTFSLYSMVMAFLLD
eukprot:symbB.v1.2.020739.t1/scaffold1762.1/size182224/6